MNHTSPDSIQAQSEQSGEKSLHTPGPWRASTFKEGTLADDFDALPDQHCINTDFHATGKIKNGPEARLAIVVSGDTASECGRTHFNHRISDAEAAANARLMAAAPTMLAALVRTREKLAIYGNASSPLIQVVLADIEHALSAATEKASAAR